MDHEKEVNEDTVNHDSVAPLRQTASSQTLMKVKVSVAQSCPTLCDPMDCSPPGSSVHGDSPGKNTGVDNHSLLQGIFPTQGLNPGLLHCRQILYHKSDHSNINWMPQMEGRVLWTWWVYMVGLSPMIHQEPLDHFSYYCLEWKCSCTFYSKEIAKNLL